jgi:hypothetical protein
MTSVQADRLPVEFSVDDDTVRDGACLKLFLLRIAGASTCPVVFLSLLASLLKTSCLFFRRRRNARTFLKPSYCCDFQLV